MKTMIALLLFMSPIFSLGGQSRELIICTKLKPTDWRGINGGYVATGGKGPGVVIDVKNKVAAWVSSGGFIQITGVRTPQGVALVRIEGSNPVKETILQMNTQTSERYAGYHFKLRDSFGGEGHLTVVLNGKDPGNMEGQATWSNVDGSRENLAYCTTFVREF